MRPKNLEPDSAASATSATNDLELRYLHHPWPYTTCMDTGIGQCDFIHHRSIPGGPRASQRQDYGRFFERVLKEHVES